MYMYIYFHFKTCFKICQHRPCWSVGIISPCSFRRAVKNIKVTDGRQTTETDAKWWQLLTSSTQLRNVSEIHNFICITYLQVRLLCNHFTHQWKHSINFQILSFTKTHVCR